MGYIYVLKNKINGKMYIGKTINIIKRFTGHKNSGNKANIPICNAIKQYTFDGFDKYIYSGIPNNILNEIETELILRLNTLSPNGYNLVAIYNKNTKISDETKKKMRESHLGKPGYWTGKKRDKKTIEKMRSAMIGKYCGEKNHFYGKKHSNETKRIIGLKGLGRIPAIKGKHHTDKTKEKLRISHTGLFVGEKSPWYGKHHTEEQKEKWRKWRKNKFMGKEHPRARRVKCIDTGEIFDCITDIKRKYGFHTSNISKCCKGKLNKTYGYEWEYLS